MTTQPTITRAVRITLTDDQWTALRVEAARNGQSVTAAVNAVVRAGSIPIVDIDANARARFTKGDCFWLALALHKRTGWDVICADDKICRHFGVVTPDGNILDIEGEHDPDEWSEEWAYEELAYENPEGEGYDTRWRVHVVPTDGLKAIEASLDQPANVDEYALALLCAMERGGY